MAYSKKEIRRAYIARLQQLDMDTRLREERRINSKLFDTQEWLSARCIALTMSHSFEIDTAPLILHARHLGQRVVVPRTLKDHQMEFVTIDEGTDFTETSFGVLEPNDGKVVQPDQIDLMIVPGIAFTRDGDRLGFGGGYYDRYLQMYKEAVTVGYAFEEQLFDAIPSEAHDRRLDFVVTQKECYEAEYSRM